MSTLTQYVEARALSEALLIQSEVQSPIAQEVASRNADEAFARLAALRGFRVERIAAPVLEAAE